MNIKRLTLVTATVVGLGSAFFPAEADAREYRFHVSCPDKIFVVEWGIGAIDPGREYLRVITELKTPVARCRITIATQTPGCRSKV